MRRANIAIIPARGGSKRIPGKNIRPFCGRPLIEYSIAAALASALFDRVIVSSDAAEIVAIARAAGAEAPFLRSAETANDFATTTDVLLEVLRGLHETAPAEYHSVCCIYPTAPFLTGQILLDSHQAFVASGAGALMPLVRYGHPIQRGLEIVGDRARYLWPENINQRTQDLPPRYHDCGQFYWFDWRAFMDHRTMFSGEIAPFIMDETRVQDIDTPEDWALAELKLALLNRAPG